VQRAAHCAVIPSILSKEGYVVTKMAKAAVLNRVEGEFQIKEYEVPEPAPGTFILRTELAGICATDAHVYYGHLEGVPFPVILGHEFCGIIEKLGPGVTEDARGAPVKEGDRVIMVPGAPCGQCYYCRVAKTPSRCVNSNVYGFSPDDAEHVLAGGYAQYVYAQFPNTAFIRTDLPANIAVLTEPLIIAIHGISRAGVQLGDTAVIQGSGAIGLGALVFSRYAGAAKTIVIGGPRKRLELCKEFGADVVIDINELKDPEERIRIVKEETIGNRGGDIVFECAGVPAAIPEGLMMVRDSGRYVELGHFTDVGPMSINPHTHMMRKNVDIFSCWGGGLEYFLKGVPLLERREYPYEKIAHPIVGLERIKDGIDAIIKGGWMLDGEEVFKIAVDPWL